MRSAIFSGGKMLKYFMKFKPGWWVLHAVAIGLTFYLGHMVKFVF
jgi:hypothetical protein